MKRPTAQAHEVVSEAVRPGDTVVDATAGNGHDTLFLARLVGERGKVIAFDVQPAAIESTRRQLEAAGVTERVELHCESHTHMASWAEADSVRAVMFNLGYLPGGDHSLITRTTSTLPALDAAADLLAPGGVLTVVCYPGHSGGAEESEAVRAWIEARGGEVFPQAREGAPFLVVWERSYFA
mgnify:FL=1